MLFCMDVGNTRVKVGWFRDGELVRTETWSYDQAEGSVRDAVGTPEIKAAIVADVTGRSTQWLTGIEEGAITLLSSETPLPIALDYHSPSTLGVDRIAVSVGGWNRFPGKPVLVINAGTCITYDVITETGQYLGGAISPGVHMRFRAMHEFTARLPHPPEQFPSSWIGKDTATSLNSGVFWGITHEMEGYIARVREQFSELQVVISGGSSEAFASALKYPIFADNFLVLRGLHRILQEIPPSQHV